MKRPKSESIIAHTLQAWAAATDTDPHTLKKALLKVDYETAPRVPIPFKVIKRALFGEIEMEKLRGLKRDNDDKDRDAKIRDGTLIEWEIVEKMVNELLVLPLIAALDAAPDEVSREWIEKVLKPAMRAKLQKPIKK